MNKSHYAFFLLALIFSLTACTNVDEELKKDGIIVQGKILDGQLNTSRSLRRSSKKRVLKVSFTTKEKENYVKEITVDANTYETAFKGKEINLAYSKSNPDVFKIITKYNVKQFMNVEQRDLSAKDFKQLLDSTIKNPKDIKSKLDKIQYGWEIFKDQRSSEGIEFVNTEEQKEIYIIPNKVIVYGLQIQISEFRRKDIAPAIFKDVDEDTYTTEYVTEAMKQQLNTPELKDLKTYYRWNDLSIFKKRDIKKGVDVYYIVKGL
jgi:hypothetical protein